MAKRSLANLSWAGPSANRGLPNVLSAPSASFALGDVLRFPISFSTLPFFSYGKKLDLKIGSRGPLAFKLEVADFSAQALVSSFPMRSRRRADSVRYKNPFTSLSCLSPCMRIPAGYGDYPAIHVYLVNAYGEFSRSRR